MINVEKGIKEGIEEGGEIPGTKRAPRENVNVKTKAVPLVRGTL